MIGKYKAIDVDRPLDLRNEADQKVFIARTFAIVRDVLQKQVDDYLPSKGLLNEMIDSVAAGIAGINHINARRPDRTKILVQGVDWDIFECDGYLNVQRDDDAETCTDDEACEAAAALGIVTDPEGYVLDEHGVRKLAQHRSQRSGDWRESLS